MSSNHIFSRTWQALRRYRDYLWCAVTSDLRIQFSGTYLGAIWWLLDPLLYLLVYVLVIQVIFQRGGPNYPAFIFNALLPWKWASTAIMNSADSIRAKSAILMQVYVPKFLLPLQRVGVSTCDFLMGSVVLVIMNLAYGGSVTWHLIEFVPVVLVQFTLLLGVGLLLSHAGVFFLDVRNFLSFGLRILFYLSPALYSVSDIPARIRPLWWLNPMTALYSSYRLIFMEGRSPLYLPLAIWFLIALLSIGAGLRLLSRYDRSYTKVS
jgi:ABC-type polysaccharide/polyol phosphate export permease